MTNNQPLSNSYIPFISIVLGVFLSITSIETVHAQSNNTGIIFQALARDDFQNPAINKSILIQSSIIQGSKTGVVVFSEEHITTTDLTGVFTISVGLGNKISGIKANLLDIDWSNGPYYINIKFSLGASSTLLTSKDWIDLGTTSFGVVPYALNILGSNKVVATDTVSLGLKLNISDTSSMLSKRIAKDTFYLSKRIDLKLSTADSINGYVTKYQLDSKSIDLTPIYNKLYTKLNLADTNLMLANYVKNTDLLLGLNTKLNAFDTASMLNNRISRDTINLSNRINSKAAYGDLINGLALKATISDLSSGLASKVDKVIGKGLSTNDFTTIEKNKLAGISGINTGDQDLSNYVTHTDLALKANTSDLTVGLASKVDKVIGKGLSTNDFTTIEKNKLAGISGINTGDQDLSNYATYTDLALKANTSDVYNSLLFKANSTDVTAGLLLKANITDVNNDLATKAKSADVTANLLLKENLINKSEDINLGGASPTHTLYPSQKAVKTYVDGQISAGGVSDGSILTRHIANGNITTALIADASITDAKIAMGINKTKVGLGNVENIALSTWTGSSQIGSLGTISSGIWSGTTIAIANGGTGATNAIDARDHLGLAIGRDVQGVLTVIQAGVLSNTSGINTGDETSATIKSKLGITMLSGVNTGDQDLSSYATTTNLALKANASDVTSSLLLKANASDVTSSLALKANSSDVTSSLSTKVDKVSGKDLSTNDYTTAEKTKLSAISGTNTGDQDLSSYATTTNLALKANASDVTTSLALKANLISPTLVTPTLGVATATSISSGTITSTSDIVAKRYKLTMPTAITATSTTTLDLSTGNMFTINLGLASSNFDVSNAGVGTYLIKFVQDATGSRDVIFPAAWKWSGGIAPNLTNTAGKLDIVTLIYDGSTFYATIVSNF